jgi:hypothetical protein
MDEESYLRLKGLVVLYKYYLSKLEQLKLRRDGAVDSNKLRGVNDKIDKVCKSLAVIDERIELVKINIV